jgi:uncharacterized protein
MILYDLTVPVFDKALQNVDRWIDKAIEFGKAKKFDPNDLLTARLAPDQFPLSRQIMSVCDQAKLVCARVTAREAPVHPDTEKTWDELRIRVRSVREYLGTFKPSDFEGAEERVIALPWMPGKVLSGTDYVIQFAQANFAFHFVHVYALLRHNGIELGKADYLGPLPFRDA